MPAPQAETKPQLLPRSERLGVVFAGLVAIGVVGATILEHHRAAGDQPMSPAAQQARLAAFQQAGQLPLTPVAPSKRAEALASMNLAELPAETRAAIENGSEPLTWLTLWDDQYEDGDTVEISSHGFSRTIRLTNSGVRIAVPLPEGGVVNVRGVYDGGGGITVAIRTPQGQVALPIMAVGQVVGVPVQAKP